MRQYRAILNGLVALALVATRADSQAWRQSAATLGTTARVLFVGTRPEDEDNALIAWLSLGRNVETAYLSLTRGESGINANGAERESALAVVRTAELLAERARDGAHQYFSRAYDFGTPTADSVVEAVWPRDSLLRDFVSVVRAFRPHVIVVLDNGPSERDATKRLTSSLIREAFTLAADTVRLPSRTTSRLPAWSVSRLYTRIDSATPDAARMSIDVGDFDNTTGRTYAELGADIRKLQRSQPTPVPPGPGLLKRWLRIDSTRTGDAATMFGSLDTTLSRFTGLSTEALAQLDTLRHDIAATRAGAALESPDSVATLLAHVASRTSGVRLAMQCTDVSSVPACAGSLGDLAVSLNTIRDRADRAMLDAAGIVIDGSVSRELVAAGDSVPFSVTIYNRGGAPVTLRRIAASPGNVISVMARDASIVIPPDSAATWSSNLRVLAQSHHWWQVNGLMSHTMLHDFATRPTNPVVAQMIVGEDRIIGSRLEATLSIGGVDVPVILRPLVYRAATASRGDDHHPLAGVPGTSVLLERTAEYERAGLPIDRLFRVYVWSARSVPDTLAVALRLPPGLKADSMTRTAVIPAFGARDVFFRLHGTLKPGTDTLFANARAVSASLSGAGTVRVGSTTQFTIGFVSHDYSHIPTQQFVRFASDRFEAVDVRIPARLNVAYVKGTDDLATPLGQLQVKFKTMDPALLPIVDLSGFTTVLLGQDALTTDALAIAVPSLLEFMRGGGTVVVMPRRNDIGRTGLLPYPVSFDLAPASVNDPASEITILNAKAQLLNWPNTITAKDFADWSGNRARGVPVSFDNHYSTVISTGDANATPTAGTLLVARVGKGAIVYSALSIDTQLAATNSGAARLLINLLSAGMPATKDK